MTDAPETDGTGRVRFKYLSDDKSPVSLPGNADATPSVIRPGDVVEVNAEAAELMLDDPSLWELTEETLTVPLSRREQREAEERGKLDEATAADTDAGRKAARDRNRADQTQTGTDGDNTGEGDPA